jgi:predicted alpha-1,6-mannanase (GH76 family)
MMLIFTVLDTMDRSVDPSYQDKKVNRLKDIAEEQGNIGVSLIGIPVSSVVDEASGDTLSNLDVNNSSILPQAYWVWNLNKENDSNYFPLNGYYVDTTPLRAPAGKVIKKIYFRKKFNRLAPGIVCSLIDGSEEELVINDDNNSQYFPIKSAGIYLNTSSIEYDSPKLWTGFQLTQGGNRISFKLLIGGAEDWQGPQYKQFTYFPKESDLSSMYADTNMITIDPTKFIGFSFFGKGNRFAPMILTSEMTNFSTGTQTSISYYDGCASQLIDGFVNRYYDSGGNIYGIPDAWRTVIAAESLLENLERVGDGVVKNGTNKSDTIHRVLSSDGGLRLSGTDDWLWFIIAQVKYYDYTKSVHNLEQAKSRWNSEVEPAWTNKCNGGYLWDTGKTYKNAITNELAIYAAMELCRVTGNPSYSEKASNATTWFKNSGMINSDFKINDGLTDDCQNNGGTCWTYNQGVILGGLIAQNIFDLTDNIVNSIILGNAQSISQEAMPSSFLNSDQQIFKGIYMRYLAYYVEKREDVEKQKIAAKYIIFNANQVWQNGINSDGYASADWQKGDSTYSAETQISAISLFNAAAKASDILRRIS